MSNAVAKPTPAPHVGARTLTGQLRRRVTVIVALLAILLAAGTILAARTIVYNQIDAQLDTASVLQQRGRPGGQAPGIGAPGMPDGTIVLASDDYGNRLGNRITEGDYQEVTQADADDLLAVPADGEKHTVELEGAGRYRVLMRTTDENVTVAVAIPLANADHMMRLLTALAAGLGAISVGAAALVTGAVTNSATRPLRDLSRTATEVAQMPLASGEVSVPVVVPPGDLPAEHEIAQLTNAFNLMLDNVDGALAARQASEVKLRRFVADASHELRNPLAAISGYSQLAERSVAATENDPDTTFALGRISAESQRMTKLVNDLLLLARLDADKHVDPRPVDVVGTVLNAVSDARIAAPGHVWRMELPDEPFDVLADPDQLHQVIVNLLSNARKHTPAGTTVTTTVGIRDSRACVLVCDDGPGVEPDVLSRVFERFARADVARTHTEEKSTGLGLAIVKAAVESFGGSVEVASQPGRTCFTIWLRLAPTV